MSDDHTPPLRGPDLRADGIALADLADGTPSLAHADGESALVVRLGNAVHLIGATCPHYGAALVGGRVSADGPDGPVIRCPLHHAGFSLRTGEAVRAPAFDPIPCWAAEQRDGRVFAGARAAAPADARVDTTAGQTFVVVGAGAAGLAAVDMLRRRGFAGRLVLVGREPTPPSTVRTSPRSSSPVRSTRRGSRSARRRGTPSDAWSCGSASRGAPRPRRTHGDARRRRRAGLRPAAAGDRRVSHPAGAAGGVAAARVCPALEADARALATAAEHARRSW
jgi:nitrite reductase/ring-hydroxylating ferredoxin subunit